MDDTTEEPRLSLLSSVSGNLEQPLVLLPLGAKEPADLWVWPCLCTHSPQGSWFSAVWLEVGSTGFGPGCGEALRACPMLKAPLECLVAAQVDSCPLSLPVWPLAISWSACLPCSLYYPLEARGEVSYPKEEACGEWGGGTCAARGLHKGPLCLHMSAGP